MSSSSIEPPARPLSTVAVLVLFNPAERPDAAIRALAAHLGQLIVVDNTATGHPALAGNALPGNAVLLRNGNRGGLAGAYNRALQWVDDHATAASPPWKHLVFVDEDSDCSTLLAFLSDPLTLQAWARPGTAAVAPAHRDRATGLRARHLVLGRWRLHHLPREFADAREVAFVINSMSVWRLGVLHALGPYSEALAVDHVDTEYCMRARRAGLKVVLNGACEFAHSIGQRRAYRLFGRVVQSGGHGPARRAMIGRNTAWLARRYLLVEPAFAALCVARLAYEAVGIVAAEDARVRKLVQLAGGALRGLFGIGMKA